MIGKDIFSDCCSLERIVVPSSVELIGAKAFMDCTRLSDGEVTLGEGVLCIQGEAFNGCPSLSRINIPPVAFVIGIRDSRCQLLRTAMTVPRRTTMVISKWMQYRSPDELGRAEAKVNEILGRHEATVEEKVASFRKWFAYYDRLDVTTMLELAIWRVNMDGFNEEDTEARQAIRRNCGNEMNIIIPGALEFLE